MRDEALHVVVAVEDVQHTAVTLGIFDGEAAAKEFVDAQPTTTPPHKHWRYVVLPTPLMPMAYPATERLATAGVLLRSFAEQAFFDQVLTRDPMRYIPPPGPACGTCTYAGHGEDAPKCYRCGGEIPPMNRLVHAVRRADRLTLANFDAMSEEAWRYHVGETRAGLANHFRPGQSLRTGTGVLVRWFDNTGLLMARGLMPSRPDFDISTPSRLAMTGRICIGYDHH